MPVDYLAEAKALRLQIPVGFVDAVDFLKKANGNVCSARELVVEAYVKRVLDEIDVPAELALSVLERVKFDCCAAIKLLLFERWRSTHTKTEIIFWVNGNDVRRALFNLANVIEVNHDILSFNHDHTEHELLKLPLHQRSVVAICDWLNYLDEEGMVYAISFKNETVATLVSDSIGYAEYGGALRAAAAIQYSILAEHDYWYRELEEQVEIWNQLRSDELFEEVVCFLENNISTLLHRLRVFVVEHISEFP